MLKLSWKQPLENPLVLLQDFTNFLFAQHGLSPVTVGNCTSTIKRLAPKIGWHPSLQSIAQLITGMHQAGASYSHIANTSVALEHYMEFLGSPIKLGRPKKPQHLINNTLTEAEIVLLLSATKNLREKAILTLLAYSGLRNKEVCLLKIGSIDLENQVIRVIQGKGKKDRFANLAGPAIQVLASYLQQRQGSSEENLFITLRKGEPYQPQDLRKLIKLAAKRAGIKKRVFPYAVRHSLATNLLHRGCGLLAIKEQLGHAYIQTTMIYLHSAPERMKMEYKMFAPSYL